MKKWYNQIERKILIEPLIDFAGTAPNDYKIFCFSGQPFFVQVDSDRFSDHKRAFYSTDWELIDFGLMYPREFDRADAPPHLRTMLDLATKLAAGFAFCRVDFYDLPDGPRFGETTFCPGAAHERFDPVSADEWLGAIWKSAASGNRLPLSAATSFAKYRAYGKLQ
ncbi:MAG: hypothetical protein IPL18_11955 [Sphingomonadales bacterium]|nr:hypothetical protein [Sphingomonadales bacterium]